ncbi:uncharacterized protein [Physcomitrium patens]|uniref:AP2/ERF domain-containing protein n=1 Tax=Physcomitrium patens TaxID=3218 RepID=A0A2K1K9S6_PHYPA|nr:ethylene-responsive transcription factor RAP2-4-like [Physcomitrium patens]PNR50527.1 hypothetical protein PHYPA_009713 [Physcomitrium patens]|eukprot:XP_024379887.1 ethylene-responsive transcription factor RAP2-4-like [Physcomitrella patens]
MEPQPRLSGHSVTAIKRGQKRKSISARQPTSSRVSIPAEDAPNKGYIGVRWRQYPYGIRFIPRVRVPKTRYDLPLGEYRSCEEAALVRDVAAYYYGKKGAFNFKNDYSSFLPEISPQLSRQEKIDWVSACAKERGRTLFPKPLNTLPLNTVPPNTSLNTSSSSSHPLKLPLPPPQSLPLSLPFGSHPLVTAKTIPGVTIATSSHVQKPWTSTSVAPLPIESFAFCCLQGRKHES